jgi:hypothetical protein
VCRATACSYASIRRNLQRLQKRLLLYSGNWLRLKAAPMQFALPTPPRPAPPPPPSAEALQVGGTLPCKGRSPHQEVSSHKKTVRKPSRHRQPMSMSEGLSPPATYVYVRGDCRVFHIVASPVHAYGCETECTLRAFSVRATTVVGLFINDEVCAWFADERVARARVLGRVAAEGPASRLCPRALAGV